MAKRPTKIVVSPPATAAYAWLNTPDEGQQYSDGKYKVTLCLKKGDPTVETFIAQMSEFSNDLAEKEFGSVPKVLRMPHKDGDENKKEEFHGHWTITCKSKYQPGFIDDTKKPLPDGMVPMSGDLVRASFALNPYETGGNKGVSGQLRNVMLCDKRNAGNDDFADIAASEQSTDDDDDEFDI